ncbi:acyl-CoA dehydrogenase [Paraconexibacter sp.]|uniref:acyl-CoA dehydrogenase family protein n=1 Tax=Paraconexibacter sp. TaxID=2949640 RepID=UPI0035642142
MASTSYRPAAISLDSDALRRYLDGPYREVRELTRQLLAQPEHAPVCGLPTAEYRELVMERTRLLAAAGQTGMGFPEKYGGGGDVGASIAAFETLAHGDLSVLVKTGVQFGLWGGAVLHLGTERHHEAYLRRTITAELPGCFAMTEVGHGSDVQALETTATFDSATDEFVINTPSEGAWKHYIGNAACHGRIAAVFAQLHVGDERPGVHAFVVPLRDDDGEPLPGVSIADCGEKLGLNGVDNGMLAFADVRIPRDNLLDRYAQVTETGEYRSEIENPNRRFFTMIGTLIQGRVCVGGAAGTAAKNALTIAVRHGLRRRQFGPPDGDSETLLLDYRTHQRRLMPRLARTYALHFAQEVVAARLHEAFSGGDVPERDQRELETYAAGLKVMTTRHATDTIQECREACGGLGYLAENRFAALKADTDVFTTFEGDNTVLLQLVAKSLLTDYKDQFASLDPPGMVRFVAGQVVETVVEKSLARQLLGALVDVIPASDDERELRDRDYQGELLRWREEHMLASVARRLKAGIDNGFDPWRVFNFCQDHVVHTARAHIERLVFDAFAASVDRCEDGQLREALGQLCDLYALAAIEEDRGWYLEHGRLTTQRSKRITTEVNLLCMDVREQAAALVDAFGIPDAVLVAPIAT